MVDAPARCEKCRTLYHAPTTGKLLNKCHCGGTLKPINEVSRLTGLDCDDLPLKAITECVVKWKREWQEKVIQLQRDLTAAKDQLAEARRKIEIQKAAYESVKDSMHRFQALLIHCQEEFDTHADGAPDATPLAKFCNRMIGELNDKMLHDFTKELSELRRDKEVVDYLEKVKKWFQCTADDADWTVIMPAFRHPKNGYVNNQTLREAVHEAIEKGEVFWPERFKDESSSKSVE